MHIADIYTRHICVCVCACWCVCVPVCVCDLLVQKVVHAGNRSSTTHLLLHSAVCAATCPMHHATPLPTPLTPPAAFPVPTPRFERGWHWRRLLGASVGVIVLCCSLRYAVAACCLLLAACCTCNGGGNTTAISNGNPLQAARCTLHAASCKLWACRSHRFRSSDAF